VAQPRKTERVKRAFGFEFQTAHSVIVARLDRAIQYSRDGSLLARDITVSFVTASASEAIHLAAKEDWIASAFAR